MEYILLYFFHFQINLLHLQPWICLADILVNIVVIVMGTLDTFVSFYMRICDYMNMCYIQPKAQVKIQPPGLKSQASIVNKSDSGLLKKISSYHRGSGSQINPYCPWDSFAIQLQKGK